MRPQPIQVKRGDTKPDVRLHLFSEDPDTDVTTDIDLTTATRVRVLISRGDGVHPIVDRDLAARPDDGRLTFEWAAGDTDEAGKFRGEVEVTWGDGTVQTVPGGGYFEVVIWADLG